MIKKLFFLVVVFIGFFPSARALSMPSGIGGGFVVDAIRFARLANPSCIHFKIDGICVEWDDGHLKIGIRIEMWKPVLLVETVKKPFDTVLPVVGEVAHLITKTTGFYKITSSGSLMTESMRALQFNDVHIMSFPFSSFLSLVGNIVPFWCGGLEAPFPTLYYMSELDFVNWRQMADMFTVKRILGSVASGFEICDLMNLANAGLGEISKVSAKLRSEVPGIHLGNMCVGHWGVLYPRLGWNPNESEVVGSAMDVFRAVSWDSDWTQEKIAFLPVPFIPSTDDELQMALPHESGCIKIGENPAKWDKGLVSQNGDYLWIYWKHFECCKF